RGPHDRQEKAAGSATAFCPGRPPAPDDASGAEQHGTAPPRERPAPDGPDTALTPFHARSRFNSRRRGGSPFRPPTPCWASGRTPPAQRKPSSRLDQQTKETW